MAKWKKIFVPLIGFGILACLGIGCEHSENMTNRQSDSGQNSKGDLPKTVNDSCKFAKDGTCDEPVNCAFGTDETDCQAACAASTTPQLLGAACAYRNPPQESLFDSSVGTGGNLHLTGNRDGYIQVPSGEDSKKMVDRHYRIYVPASYDPTRPTPLMFFMPGHRVGMHVLPGIMNLQRTADTNRFIIAYLEQEVRSDIRYAWWTDWDWKKRPNENPDIFFLREMVKKISEDYNIDRTRIIATGQSRGAAMSIIAALEMPDLIAGASPQSGFTELDYHLRVQAYNGRRVPMYVVHGVLDTDIPVASNLENSRIEASDAVVKRLRSKGWTDQELVYLRLENVGHAWQPQYNQQMWDFLSARPLPTGGAQ